MALKVAKKEAVYTYVPVEEREADKPFSIKFKRLSPRELAELEDSRAKITSDGAVHINSSSFSYKLFKACFVGWENMLDDEGNTIDPVFENGVLSDKSVDFIPAEYRQDAANVMLSITRDPSSAAVFCAPLKPREEGTAEGQ